MISARLSLLAILLAAAPLTAAELPPPGATACAGCHPLGKVETPVPGLAGRQEEQLLASLRAYRSGEKPASIMDRIAKGVSDAQAAAIARWYNRQPPP
jgi:cytochrome c553